MLKINRVRIVILFFAFYFNNSLGQNFGWYTENNAPISIRFDDISFINDSVGWVGQQDSVFKTTDAGKTWTKINVPSTNSLNYIRSIEFINDTIGFIGCLQVNPGQDRLWRTADGGVTWTGIDSLLQVNPTGICGMAHKDSFFVAVGSVMGPASVYISSDYGQNWVYRNLSSWCSYLIDCYVFDSLNLIVSGSANNSQNQKAVILKSTDGGVNWQQVAIANNPATYAWKIFMSNNGVGVCSIEDFNQASFFKTLDSGNTWTEYPIIGTNIVNLGGIAILSDTIIFTGNQHTLGIAASFNGGNNWVNSNFTNSLDRIHEFPNGTLIGVGSTIYKYNPDSINTSIKRLEVPTLHSFKLSTVDYKKYDLNASLFRKAHLIVDIYRIDGMHLAQPINQILEKGKYRLSLNTMLFPSGNYFIRIKTFEMQTGLKFSINK